MLKVPQWFYVDEDNEYHVISDFKEIADLRKRGFKTGVLTVTPNEERVVMIPNGYKSILAPDDFVPFHPDYDEAKRQADIATGISSPHTAWLDIFIREINRWCYQAYSNVFVDEHLEDEKHPDDLSMVEMFNSWIGKRKVEDITPQEAFIGSLNLVATACRLGSINQKLLVDAADDMTKLRHKHKDDPEKLAIVSECLNSLLISVEKHK